MSKKYANIYDLLEKTGYKPPVCAVCGVEHEQGDPDTDVQYNELADAYQCRAHYNVWMYDYETMQRRKHPENYMPVYGISRSDAKDCGFDNWQEVDARYTMLRSRFEEIASMDRPGRYLFTGDPGNGKTHLLRSIIKYRVQNVLLARSMYYIDFDDFSSAFKVSYKKYSKDTEASIMARFTSYDLLIVDDFGQPSSLTDNNIRLFKMLMDHREKKDNIFSTNLENYAAIKEAMGWPIENRFTSYHWIQNKLESYRAKIKLL